MSFFVTACFGATRVLFSLGTRFALGFALSFSFRFISSRSLLFLYQLPPNPFRRIFFSAAGLPAGFLFISTLLSANFFPSSKDRPGFVYLFSLLKIELLFILHDRNIDDGIRARGAAFAFFIEKGFGRK